MKKKLIATVLQLFAILVILSGCQTKNVEKYSTSVILNDKEVTGDFTGTLEKNKASGNGIIKITDGDTKWTYDGTFVEGEIKGKGKVSSFPVSIRIADKKITGVYKGEFVDGIMDGKGIFTSDTLEIEGKFKEQKVVSGKVKQLEYEITFQNDTYSGVYSGDLKQNSPSGEGEFKAEENSFYYKGEWKDGDIKGKGYLESDKYTVVFPEFDRIGKYKGDVVDGSAEGNGHFEAVSGENIPYTYDGEWKEGLFDGKGVKVLDTKEFCTKHEGTFTKGEFTPTPIEYYISNGTGTGTNDYSPSEKARDFITQHPDFFSTTDNAILEEFVDSSIEYRGLNKSSQNYGDKLIKKSGTIIQIWEKENVFGIDVVTTINLITDDGDYYYIYYFGKLEDLYEEERITFYGLPLGGASYENIDGGTTLTQIIAGCYITK